ncbi:MULTISPECIES: tRNA-guanine transglycosylase DpdA [Actinomadura]|uniref:tRNA-guanine transglycosylase DpdA n=1 Tax=Actinomadura yumaensis TaxID=111807 RepID=A0ABW2CID5_9ACTN|nr:tRNA-guanine transglycosylase DpdA [Actinomadura sp. J1-007]MWK37181.1 queuine/other tRNA-ribosyltransferase [Actinomadura sp. J1-007]
MKFYFPDSQDQVSPTYDFLNEEYSPHRVRQRDDKYAHEVLSKRPYHGLLVSKSIVDGSVRGSGKYTIPQRERLYRLGVEKYFRLPEGMATLGDCGAFSYINEEEPPYGVKDVVDFYEHCGFQAGVSVDHVIFHYGPTASEKTVPQKWSQRRRLSLRYAQEFIDEVRRRDNVLIPVGAAQGWSPESYADSVCQLEEMGYERIALGGMTPLRTQDILECLQMISESRQWAELHLLGITRVDSLEDFSRLGVASFDSTSPFRQSFMDDRNSYHTPGRSYTAIRVPQVDGNPSLKRKVLAGQVSQAAAKSLEREALRLLRAYDRGDSSAPLQKVLAALKEYEQLVEGERKKSRIDQYEFFLEDRPWKRCSCGLCGIHGIEVAIFRGSERNKRRGFHNLAVFADKIQDIGHLPDQED